MSTDQMVSLAELLTPEEIEELCTTIYSEFAEGFQVVDIDAKPDGRKIVNVTLASGGKKQVILTK